MADADSKVESVVAETKASVIAVRLPHETYSLDPFREGNLKWCGVFKQQHPVGISGVKGFNTPPGFPNLKRYVTVVEGEKNTPYMATLEDKDCTMSFAEKRNQSVLPMRTECDVWLEMLPEERREAQKLAGNSEEHARAIGLQQLAWLENAEQHVVDLQHAMERCAEAADATMKRLQSRMRVITALRLRAGNIETNDLILENGAPRYDSVDDRFEEYPRRQQQGIIGWVASWCRSAVREESEDSETP